ncbi:wax ester/triacylglycerol synthase domain-containing protein [Dietzia aerolata]
MTGLDASFLYLETQEQQMAINGIVHLDVTTIAEGYSFERMRGGLARRVKEIPPFRRKIYDSPLNVGHPAWVEDFDFDITRHVKLIRMDAAADEGEFFALCGSSRRRRSIVRTRCGRRGSSSAPARRARQRSGAREEGRGSADVGVLPGSPRGDRRDARCRTAVIARHHQRLYT